MAKIYYVGDWSIMCGPVFAGTPFNYSYKGLETYNYGIWLKEALESTGEHEVASIPVWDFYHLGPGKFEEILDEYDVVVFSDIEAKSFQLAPSFFKREKFGKEILTFPDRIRLTIDAVEDGLGVMFLGGWLSFTGEMGKGGWNRTRLKEILPVTCLDYEDLIESTEGFTVQATSEGKKFFNMDFKSFPPILGYNKTLLRQDSQLLLTVKDTNDPLIAIRECGKGKTLAYMSDPAPHWGCNFVFWDHYPQFWLTCLDFLLGNKRIN